MTLQLKICTHLILNKKVLNPICLEQTIKFNFAFLYLTLLFHVTNVLLFYVLPIFELLLSYFSIFRLLHMKIWTEMFKSRRGDTHDKFKKKCASHEKWNFKNLTLLLVFTGTLFPISGQMCRYVLSHLVIALLVWLQWWSKVAISSEKS